MSKADDRLSLLKADLLEGMSMSMQGSYERRLPAPAALPKIRSALKGLRLLVEELPSADAWRALALAEESLLHYPAAVAALESAILLSPKPNRKDLKRLLQLRQHAAEWGALGLSPSLLQELGVHLEIILQSRPCDHTLGHTVSWLSARGITVSAGVTQSLGNAGGFCDCEVLLNVV